MFDTVRPQSENVFQSVEPMMSEAPAPEEQRPLDISDQMSHSIRPGKGPVTTCGPQADGKIVAAGGQPHDLTMKEAVGKLWSWIAGPSEEPKPQPTAVTGDRG
jgi:hypothetical protein